MRPGHRYKVGDQPCQNLKRGDADIATLGIGNGMNVHQCPVCEGNRTWCDNCSRDHHDGGWETCAPRAYEVIDDWATERAEEIVDQIQEQNWKNGGALVVDRLDAIDLLAAYFRVVRSEGALDGVDRLAGALNSHAGRA